jgi:ABC-type sugar transport system substrate-binding protein
MSDVINWLQTYGNNIIYIYGSNDPWSAGAIESIGSTNAIKIVKAGANHSISISDQEEKELVYSIINQWINQKK